MISIVGALPNPLACAKGATPPKRQGVASANLERYLRTDSFVPKLAQGSATKGVST